MFKRSIIFIISLVLLSLTPSRNTFIIVKLNAGSYPGFQPVSNTIYVPVGGQVTITSQMQMGNLANVTFDGSVVAGIKYGFKFSTTGTVFSPGNGNNQNITFKNCDFGTTATTIFDGNPNPRLVYNGTPETMVYYNLKVDTFTFGGRSRFYQGTFDDVTTYHCVNVGMELNNAAVVNDSTGENIKVKGFSLYGLRINNWRITGPTINSNDCGIFWIDGGNVQINNVYRNGGWGYLARIWMVQLGGLSIDQTSSIANCVDVNSTHYGTADVRLQPSYLDSTAKISRTGSDFYFLHNTCGDKRDDGSYVTDAIVAGDFKNEGGRIYTLHVKDNIAFNAMASGMANNSSLLKQNGITMNDFSNNIDLPPGVPLPAGYFIDKINFIPVINGPLYKKASDGTDIGATQNIFSCLCHLR